MTIKRLQRLVFALFLLLLAREGRAEACSCAGDGSPETALDHADAVFVAKIGNIERQERRQIVQMTVTRAFKGVATGASITIHTGLGGGDCGIKFGAASSWLVYASHSNDNLFYNDPGYTGLHTIPCSRTTPLAQAKTDIDALVAATSSGKTKTPPADGASPRDAPSVRASATTPEAPATTTTTIASTPQAPADASTPASTATPATATSAAPPPPQSKGCAVGPGASSLGLFEVGLFTLALLLVAFARRRSASSREKRDRGALRGDLA